MKIRTFKDRVIVYKKGQKYISASLEFDILAEGKNPIQAIERLYEATSGYLEMCCKDNESDDEIYRKAPKKYQDMYNLFVELAEKKRKKEKEKKKELSLRKKEITSAQLTYSY